MPLRRAQTSADPFAPIRDGTNAHRAKHHCGAYPFSDGPTLAVIAAAAGARRILELGTALGYTALSLARGAPEARLDTIERDPDHVRIARDNIAAAGCAQRIVVHEGDFETVLARLEFGYDVAFFDGFGPTLEYLSRMQALLRPRGVLVSSNLDVGGGAADYRAALLDSDAWLTSFALEGGRTALSVKL